MISVGNLLSYLLRVKDGRKRRGIRYSLATVLTLLILAKLCGQNKVYGIADWAQQRSGYLVEALQLKHKRLSHHSTYQRILTDEVDGDELGRVMAIINNLVISLLNSQGFDNHAHARRVFDPSPAMALAIISGL